MILNIAELLKVILLGIVEGITEWLPISSTGHMLLLDAFLPLQMSDAFKEMFFVVIQLGAILAVVVIFWEKMFPFRFKGGPVIKKDVFSMWFKVIAACIPSIILGLLFDDILEEKFYNPTSIAVMLIVYGIAFILVESWNKKRTPRIGALEDVGYGTALAIGLFQVLAMMPGTSRSGATIIGALLIGVSRTAAAEFTFFLAVPTMLGASVFKLAKFGLHFSTQEIFTLLVGVVVAFLVSLLAIQFLMSYVKKHDFKVFGWYRILLGAIILLIFQVL